MIAILTALLQGAGCAQSTGPAQSLAFPRFTQTEGRLDADGFPLSGAKLCLLEHRDTCFQMPPHTTTTDVAKVTYQFGLDPRSERLPLASGGSWVFFSAMFSAGGSGSLERIAVLRYEPGRSSEKIVNLMPYVSATNVSERAMWTISSASAYPILVHADFIWSAGEPHFGAHFYTVEAWRFDPKQDLYVKTFSYRTSKRYGDEDDSKPAHVLASERAEILRRLS